MSKRLFDSRYYLMSGLLHAYYWMDESLQAQLQAAGMPPLSRTQSQIMTNIADGVNRPSEMARRLGISRQAVQQLLSDLQQRELVELIPDPADARAKVIRYSSHGQKIAKVTIKALERIDAEIEARLGAQALQQLRQLLVESDWGEPLGANAGRQDDAAGPVKKSDASSRAPRRSRRQRK